MIFKEQKAESKKQKAIVAEIYQETYIINATIRSVIRYNSFLLFAFCFPLTAPSFPASPVS
jgi:hypothetical protein